MPRLVGDEEADLSGQAIAGRPRPWWLGVLLRGPADLLTLLARVAVTVMIAGGAACTVGSGIIHLYLWGMRYGYRNVPTIGPLFLVQGIAAIVLGLLTLASRRVLVLVLAGGMMVLCVVALVVAVDVGLFGFKDSWAAPYAWTTLYEEIAGAVLLLVAAGVLAWPGGAGRGSGISR